MEKLKICKFREMQKRPLKFPSGRNSSSVSALDSIVPLVNTTNGYEYIKIKEI